MKNRYLRFLTCFVAGLFILSTTLSAKTNFFSISVVTHYKTSDEGNNYFMAQVKKSDSSSFVVGYYYNETKNTYKSALVDITTFRGIPHSDLETVSTDVDNEYFLEVVMNQESDYAVVGSSAKLNTSDYDGWFVVLDKDNITSKVLEKKYDALGTDVLTGLVQNRDGGYTLVGYTIDSNDYQQGWLLRVDKDGQVIHSTYLGDAGISKLTKVNISSNNQITAIGEAVSVDSIKKGVIVTIDDNGLVTDKMVVENADLTDIHVSLDDQFLITGSKDMPDSEDLLIMKVDNNLNVLIDKTYPEVNNEKGMIIQESSENHLVVVGYTSLLSDDQQSNAIIIKTDRQGTLIDVQLFKYESNVFYRDFEFTDNDELMLVGNYFTNDFVNPTIKRVGARLEYKVQYNSVDYNGNGGVGNDYQTGYTTKGNPFVVKENVYVKEGYDFIGWALSKEKADQGIVDIAEKGTYSLPTNDAVVFYAVWTPIEQYTLTYDGNQNTDGLVPNDLNKYATDELAVILNEGSLVKDGYHFVGWTLDQENLGDVLLPGDEILMNENKTLFAKWEINPVIETYQVTYHANGADQGEVPVDDQMYLAGDIVKVKENVSLLKKGHHFTGWSLNPIDDESLILENSDIEIEQHLILFAQWSPNEYQITYDLDGGVNHPDNPQSFIYGIGVQAFERPTKEGFTFLGWSNDTTGSELITGIDANVDSDQTIYALWIEDRESPVNPVDPNEKEDNNKPINKDETKTDEKVEETNVLPNTGISTNHYLGTLVIFAGLSMLIKQKKGK